MLPFWIVLAIIGITMLVIIYLGIREQRRWEKSVEVFNKDSNKALMETITAFSRMHSKLGEKCKNKRPLD